MKKQHEKNEIRLFNDFKYLWIGLVLLVVGTCCSFVINSDPMYKTGSCVMQLGIRYYIVGYDSGTYTTVQYISFKGELQEFRAPILVSKSAVETMSANIVCPTGFGGK